MKIVIKTLKGQQLPLEVEEDTKISTLKEQIQTEHAMPAESQKLIAYGKVMDDSEKTLKDYKITEGGFIVVMVQKAKPAPANKSEDKKEEESVQKPSVELQPLVNPPAITATSQPAAQTQPAATTQQTTAAQAQPASTGPAVDEEVVGNLQAISGKPRELCVQALTAAFGDPDRAFQYLDSGIPQMPPGIGGAGAGGMPPGMGGDPMAGMDQPGDYGDEGEDPGADAGLAALQQFANNPQFIPLRQRMIQNPQFYQEFMQMLQNEQPALYQVIQQNPMAFMNLMMGGDVNAGGGAGAGAGIPGAGGMGGMPGAGAGVGAGAGMPGVGGAGGPRPGSIQVTAVEMEAIQRLCSLGFSQNRAVQAYFACDKNEEFAANFLFESVAEDDAENTNQAMVQSTGAAQAQPTGAQSAQAQPAAQSQPAASTEAQPAQVPAQAEPANDVDLYGEQPNAQPAAAQQPPQPDGSGAAGNQNSNDTGNNNANNNGGNDPDAGAGAGGAGGDQVEKSAFE